jgi:hypothetical protein
MLIYKPLALFSGLFSAQASSNCHICAHGRGRYKGKKNHSQNSGEQVNRGSFDKPQTFGRKLMRHHALLLTCLALMAVTSSALAQDAPANSPFQVETATDAQDRSARATLNEKLLAAQAQRKEDARKAVIAARAKAKAEKEAKAKAEMEAARLKAEQERLARDAAKKAAAEAAAAAAAASAPTAPVSGK